MDDIYRLVKEREIKNASKEVALLVEVGDYESKKAEAIGEKYGVCIEVFEMSPNSSRRLMNADILSHCAIHDSDGSSVFKIYQNTISGGGVYLEYFRYDSDRNLYYSVGNDAISAGAELSMIYAVAEGDVLMLFNSVVSPISATTRTFYYLLGSFSMIILIFTLVFTGIISRYITKPLRELTSAARRFGRGELDASFRVSGYAEAEELSSAISYASGELSKTEVLRRDLIANISHDLRTPITLITGYAEMMRDLPGENTPENLSNIVNESERLNALISDVLDYSKLVSGTLPFKPVRFSLTDRVAEICARYDSMLKKDGFTVTFEHNEDVAVYADPEQINRVLVNFLSNAIAHSGDEKLISVVQAIDSGGVKISVTDRGVGIPASELPGIWERYYKGSQNGARSAGSSGLGLSIVKAILDRSGGAYGVQSQPGVGSTFWFWLRY